MLYEELQPLFCWVVAIFSGLGAGLVFGLAMFLGGLDGTVQNLVIWLLASLAVAAAGWTIAHIKQD